MDYSTFINEQALYSRRKASIIIGCDIEALNYYIDNVCVLVSDFRSDSDLNQKCFLLNEYQLWVAQTVINLMRFVRSKYSGKSYRYVVRNLVNQNKDKFSKVAWNSYAVNVPFVS